jgi:hypothetical protein
LGWFDRPVFQAPRVRNVPKVGSQFKGTFFRECPLAVRNPWWSDLAQPFVIRLAAAGSYRASEGNSFS